jgi:acid phosphatase type 7
MRAYPCETDQSSEIRMTGRSETSRCPRNELLSATPDRASMRKDGLIRSTILAGLLAITLALGAGSGLGANTRAQPQAPDSLEAGPSLVAAGDIASCSSNGDEATAALLDGLAGTIATLGDHAYESGTEQEFAECYDPSWGRYKSRTRPSAGNHDYGTNGAAGYFAYFGAAAGEPEKGYYSYDLGTWHIVVLNSNCSQIGGCGGGTPQERWLRDDLAAHPVACTLAYWHHPRFSSGEKYGTNEQMTPLWQALYEHGADVVLSGHEHNYERFAPQDANGNLDEDRGIRQFVVGTGGKSLYGFGAPLPTSEVRNAEASGVLMLRLHATGYDWKFVPVPGTLFDDTGAWPCH